MKFLIGMNPSNHPSFRDPFPRPYDELPVADPDVHLVTGPEREVLVARDGRRNIDYNEPLGMAVDLTFSFERHVVTSYEQLKSCVYMTISKRKYQIRPKPDLPIEQYNSVEHIPSE